MAKIPFAVSRHGCLSSGGFRQVPRPRRTCGRSRRASGEDARLHAIPRDVRAARGLSHDGVRTRRAYLARRNACRHAREAGQAISGSGGTAVLRPLGQGGGDGPHAHGGEPRGALRPLVESGRREPGVRPGVPHRTEAKRPHPQVRDAGNARGAHRRDDQGETRPCRRALRRRRREARHRNDRRRAHGLCPPRRHVGFVI